MREIVIVPAWRRPAFLAATLRRLEIADEGSQEFWVAIDRRPDVRVTDVASAFRHRVGANRVRVIHREHRYRGNSYNVLRSYAEAVRSGADLIHLVEEDVFVAGDYFAFHRAAHALDPNAFAVSAARNQNYAGDPEPDPTALYRDRQYQSVAVSFRPERLLSVLKHVGSMYYSNPVAYCQRTFHGTKIPHGNAEQDGLINRVVERAGAHVTYGAHPRAYHAGFIGYHRNGEDFRAGTPVATAADWLLGMGAEELNRRAHSYPDHHVVELDAERPPPDHIVAWP